VDADEIVRVGSVHRAQLQRSSAMIFIRIHPVTQLTYNNTKV
jgi:hypothetical protein